MTLTFELIQDAVMVHCHTKYYFHSSNGSAGRVLTDTQTDTQTDGTNSITSTADAGGKNLIWYIH